jgi:hypothetical protein
VDGKNTRFILSFACKRVANGEAPAAETADVMPSPTPANLPAEKGLVRIAARNVFKEGETKVDRFDLSAIPNSPAIPTIYLPSGENFHVASSTVATEVAAIIKVQAESETEFKQVRILRLESNDLYPDGFNWQDCTVEPKDRPKLANDKFEQGYLKQFETYLPNFEHRTVTCLFDRIDDPSGQYFVVVSQKPPIPTTRFTEIEAKISDTEKLEASETMYVLSISNKGAKTAAEVNLVSHFDGDTEVISTETSNGRCQRSRYGSSHGSIVCYLGALAPGDKANIRFRSRPSRDSGRPGPRTANNENWFGYGIAKESEDDGYWPANNFRFGKGLTRRK